MTIPFNTLVARIELAAITDNYELLRAKSPGVVPVIKADAYGHGLFPVAWALARAGARALAVGTVAEAAHLRSLPYDGRILSLLGPIGGAEDDLASEPAGRAGSIVGPTSESTVASTAGSTAGPCPGGVETAGRDDFELIVEHDITPFIHDLGQLTRLGRAAARANKTVSVALKFDTGMGRLGFTRRDVDAVLNALKRHPGVVPVMLGSHLATADDAEDDAYATSQGQAYGHILERFAAAGYALEVSLANSAAILARPDLSLGTGRAGISLYGANPFWGTRKSSLGSGLRPAMSVSTKVVSVHDLPAGAGISYGLTYTARTDTRVAIVQAGYADAYSRQGSNVAWMTIRGVRVPVVGRVCMQLTAVDVGQVPQVKPGDTAWLLGGDAQAPIRPEELAQWWGSIPYEVFCLLGLNKREYV